MTARGARAAAPVPVLYVHNGLNWITGSERCLLDLVAHIDRARYSPVVWCNAPALREAAAALGATVYASPEWSEHGALLPNRDHVRAARDIVRRHRIGLIHANDAEPLRALVPVAFGERIPLLAHLHLRMTPDERRWSLLHQVSLAVGVSETSVRGLRDDGFPVQRTTVIYNGVDPERLSRGDARGLRETLGIAAADVVFAVVGSLIPRKGIDVVLRALVDLCAQRADCHLLICGDGPEEAALRAHADALGVAGRAHFLGRRPDVGAVVRDAADVLVSAAREESFGLNIAEAAVFAVPAIASDIAAHGEIVTDGIEGVLVPVNDPAALARAMADLAGDAARRARMGDAARERTREAFLVHRYISDFESAYGRLLAAPSGVYGWPRGFRWPQAYTLWAVSIARKQAGRVFSRASRARPLRG